MPVGIFQGKAFVMDVFALLELRCKTGLPCLKAGIRLGHGLMAGG